jgi:outer membrane protein OmpA-like peptidoglycan-associated protein
MRARMHFQVKAAMTPSSPFTPARSGLLQRKCACGGSVGVSSECEECRRKRLQRKTLNAELGMRNDSAVPPIVHEVLRSPGQPLDHETREFMEPRFGHDFGHVRVHTDARAAESTQVVAALAYTVGSHIAFAAGSFLPGTTTGRKLLAHELTHVVQQDSGAQDFGSLGVASPHSAAEGQAEEISKSIANSRRLGRVTKVGAAAPLLQRQLLGSGGLRGDDDESAMLWESFRQSIAIDHFDSDKAILKPEHVAQLKQYKERFQTLLGRYPDSFISVIGHTDATDTEPHNKTLGQERADAVMRELTSGDNPLPAGIIHSGSLGETALAVETKGREPRNRRVEIIPRLRRFVKLPPPAAPQTFGPGPAGEQEEPQEAGGKPPSRTVEKPKGPDLKIHQRNWLEEALKKDPVIKGLPDWARDKVIDALKDGDEKLAEKVIDTLPLDEKVKGAVQAVVKSLLQLAKGKKFKMPEAPPRQPEFGPTPGFPKMPGEVIIPGPKIPF